MIHILFVPGSFGSTINLVAQSFCKNIESPALSLEESILSDGSAHGFYKEGHWCTKELFANFLEERIDQDIKISTPTYPYNGMTVQEIFSQYQNKRPYDKVVIIYIKDMNYAELNLLAQYYKISAGSLSRGLEYTFYDEGLLADIKKWNKEYNSFNDMRPWELREFFSLYYTDCVKDWLNAQLLAPSNWLKISTYDLLNNSRETFKKVCNFIDEFDNSKEIEFNKFSDTWLEKQRYLIKELELVNKIVDYTTNQKITSWTSSQLCLLSEAMIQKKLRDNGYDLKCYGLDTFPTDSIQLYRLMEKL
jgi:hypothetical protein